MPRKPLLHPALGLVALLSVVFLIYLPVRHAGFVWDDLAIFQGRAWMYQGNDWFQRAISRSEEWADYFRPLVVALFVLQARLFDGMPGPIHIVSLAMQLANVVLVVLLARRLVHIRGQQSHFMPLFAGAFFGLHPMLVETVVWISCQYDQMQVLFALAGLLASVTIVQRWPRAIAVSACFFLSACSKESAALFPFIVLVFDWLVRSEWQLPPHHRLLTLWRTNWPVYVLLIFAGLAYVTLRTWAIGSALGDARVESPIPDANRIDEIAFVYLRYWQVIAGIPIELSPIHPVASMEFGKDMLLMTLRVAGSLGLAGLSLLIFSRRFAATGALILVTGAYLFPVLGFITRHFDGSLYHERYAIGAIAMTAVLMPVIVSEWRPLLRDAHLLRKVLAVLAACWLAWAALNVRVTIPLWSNGLNLWRWAVELHPDDVMAKANLLNNLSHPAHAPEVRALVDDALRRQMDCDMCYINGLSFAVRHGDRALAQRLRAHLRDTFEGATPIAVYSYLLFDGYAELRDGNPVAAEAQLKRALALQSSSSFTHLLLAEALMAQGRSDEAEAVLATAEKAAHPLHLKQLRDQSLQILKGHAVYAVPFESGHAP